MVNIVQRPVERPTQVPAKLPPGVGTFLLYGSLCCIVLLRFCGRGKPEEAHSYS